MRLEELADLVLDLFDPLRLLKIGQEARLDDGILQMRVHHSIDTLPGPGDRAHTLIERDGAELFNELFVHDLLHSDVRVYRWRAWRVRKVTAKRPDGQARPPRTTTPTVSESHARVVVLVDIGDRPWPGTVELDHCLSLGIDVMHHARRICVA